ncbi:HepT-like ribonuclease domain-containing protein [Pseudonocardia sp. KRD291]|uniref:type VII toxin-antitoxin system HepT family RNase toxin n=1 Tax=Pseudonocardia sp. KRD291 TaxID=2792007 RepID=UPI001C49EFFD|nr:HepT-like ribonuclease domain-containing protein [Pseudonocardia sp. KRD291]
MARLLRAITDDLAVLGDESTANAIRRADPLWIRGIKYVFVTAIEGCVDVAHHICSSEGWGPPRDNADAVRVLGRHGVISTDLAERLSRAVGFRNVLVHDYVDVDDRVVLARLDDPSDLALFATAVSEWIHPPR